MDKVIKHIVESNIMVQRGHDSAFLTIPQTNGNDITVKYITYAAKCFSLSDLDDWIINDVVNPLILAGTKYLYFRHTSGVDRLFYDGMHILRLRIAALDGDLDPVIIDSLIKLEGERIREVQAQGTIENRISRLEGKMSIMEFDRP